MAMPTHRVPESAKPLYEALVAATDSCCDAILNDEYKELCRRMAAAICRKRTLRIYGKLEGWAAGIVFAMGRVNFLSDPTQKPYATAADIAQGFHIGEATLHAKAKIIRDAFKLTPFHPEWTLPSRMDSNPRVWALNVNGFEVDARWMPREVQEIAFRKGLIPYVPADRAKEPSVVHDQ